MEEVASAEDGRHRGKCRWAAWPRLLRDEGGAVIVFVALMIPVLVGAAGLAVDLASWYATKRTVQTGADAAAYAAALDLARQGLTHPPDLAALQAVADDAAGRNGVATPVEVNTPPGSGPAASDPSSVEVIATQPARLHFAALFLDTPPAITARAVAKAVVSDACVWSLHPTEWGAVTVSGTAELTLGCGLLALSTDEEALRQTGTSCVSATSITLGGGYSGDCVSPRPEVLAPDYGDPLQSLAPPSHGACDHAGKVKIQGSGGDDGNGNGSGGSGPAMLMPGVYCGGIEINGDVVLEPGLYVLAGGRLKITGNATVTNNENAWGGVTFYLTGSGNDYATVEIASGAKVTLTPMTAGALANVLFFQDRDAPEDGTNKIAGGATMDLTGILYFPSQSVEFAGGSSAHASNVLIVTSTLKFTGNAYLNADYAQSLLPEAYHARFVE